MLPFEVFRKNDISLFILLSFFVITGIVFCLFFSDPFDNQGLPDIALYNSGISYQTFNQVIFSDTQIQPNSIPQECINAISGRSPPQSILF